LIKGSEGIFKVVLDGTILFSKHETGRFPESGEVLDLIPAAP
jgi:predicted Rdx family selenoprotein